MTSLARMCGRSDAYLMNDEAMAKISWTTGGSNKRRAMLYPAALLAIGALVWVGWFHEPEPQVGALLSSADALAQVGAFDKADAELDRVFAQEPNNLHGWLSRAMIREFQREYEQAVGYYRHALLLHGQDDEVARNIRLSISDILRRDGRFEEAEKSLDELEKSNGEHAVIHRVRGAIDLDEGRLVDAAEHFAKYQQADPESVEAVRMHASTLILLGRLEQARTLLARAEDMQGIWSMWPALAQSCLEAGDTAGAGSALARFIDLDERGREKLGRHAYWADVVESGQLDELLN